MARTPEQSDYTSIKARLRSENDQGELKTSIEQMIEVGELNHLNVSVRRLMPFTDCVSNTNNNEQTRNALPMYEREYFLLMDETARIVQCGKRGRMDPHASPILERLGLNESDEWIDSLDHFRRHYRNGETWIKKTA